MKIAIILASLAAVITLSAADSSAPQPVIQPAEAPHATQRVDSFEAVQAEYFKRFLDAPGFGRSRMVVPEIRRPLTLVFGGTNYQVRPPQLIGLEDEPIVYIPLGAAPAKAELTNKELRKSLRTRSLTDWESTVVVELRSGREIALASNRVEVTSVSGRDSRDELRMLGALRAGQECVKCHECQPGKLLGAFSYTLVASSRTDTGGTNGVSVVSSGVRRPTTGSFHEISELAGSGLIGWGEAPDEPALARPSAATAARADARPTRSVN